MRTFSRQLASLIRLFHWVMWSRVVRWGAFAFGLVSLALVFGVASRTMYGIEHGINLIAYWHIPLAFLTAFALSTTFIGSLLYLRYEGRFWNRLAHSGGEIGFLFATLTLATGSMWGRVVWNSWWEWSDIRLVTFLIVWLIYAGYLAVYASTERGSDERFAAVYGVVAFVTVPITYTAGRLWSPTFHEPTIANSSVSANIDPLILGISFLALALLYIYVMAIRIRLHEIEDKIILQKEEVR
ncbi:MULTISPECIES: cytochrome c biogenesis protein [Natrialbaceae]|uniref:cytochrome c biogenesis protein n=1 Tax=Natrialbaceae TaxID=1644061 RepID=UPI001BB121DF|nr:cytochrome c biogenesis protein CcsA [Haloterrigena sp. H1]